MRKDEIPALTGLRFVAAAAILMDHTWPVIFKFDSLSTLNDAAHQLAYVGMTLFFVLSGFIIHHNYSDIVRRPGGLWQFAVARFSRLYPLYLLVLALDFMLVRPPLDWMALRMLTMTQTWTYQFDGARFVPWGYRYSVVAWSISTEVFFYVVYPAISAVLHRVPARAAIVGSSVVGTGAMWWFSAHPAAFDTFGWLTYSSPYMRVLEFATGCSVAQAYRSGYRLHGAVAVFAAGYIALFTLRGFTRNEGISVGMAHLGLLVPTAALVYALATSDTFPWLRRPFAVRMGDASYSMYLLHLIVAERLAFNAPLAGTLGDWVNAWARFLIALLIIGALSLASYRWIEAPSRKWLRALLMGHWYSKTKASPAAAFDPAAAAALGPIAAPAPPAPKPTPVPPVPDPSMAEPPCDAK